MNKGYYVWARTTSVAWFLNKEQAEAYAKQLSYYGGCVYTVVPVN